MPDFRSRLKNRRKKPKIPEFKIFNVQKDKRGGFNVKLNWEYSDSKVVGFRIYKAVMPMSLAQRTYRVSQRALEKLTPAKSPRVESQILFSKNFFVENKNVNFFFSETGRFREEEKRPTQLNYGILNFIRTNQEGKYSFVDKDIQFGKTYTYVLTALTKDYQETPKGPGLIVNVEDLKPPNNVENLQTRESSGGIAISFNIKDHDEVESYIVFRRKIGDRIFSKIFEGKIFQKNGVLVDETAQAGNEYEYKVYLRDYFGNISWHSPPSRSEFKSRILSKGAIMDPIVRIRYQEPNFVIEGKINSPKIIGYRIERQDVWRKEKKFEIKKSNEIPWPNVHLFDNLGFIKHSDTTAYPGNVYRYRISSISITGKTESIYVSPPIRPRKGTHIETRGFVCEDCQPIKITNFQANALYTNQNPVYVKIWWDILGDWDYLKITSNEGTQEEKIFRVDNPHYHIFSNNFEKGTKNKLKMRVFNRDNEFIDSAIVTLNL